MRSLLFPVIDDTLAALKANGTLKLDSPPRYVVDPPKQAAHGDLSCNVAMVIAKPEGKNPKDIAQALVSGLVDKHGVVERAEVAGAGFVNFTLRDAVVQRIARDVLAAGATWGRRAPKSSGKRVNVEFCSANPTGPIHVGHARGTFTGDAIARLLAAAGHDVTREFYINDFGKQVHALGDAVQARYLELRGLRTVKEGDIEYPGEYVIEIARKFRARHGDSLNAGKLEGWHELAREFAIAENMAMIRATLERARVHHDVFSSEAALHEAGKVIAVVGHYKERGATYEADKARDTENKKRRDESKAAQFEERQQGGTFLETSKHGDEEDRVILRKDGTPVYLTADLAYHKDKLERSDRVVDVLGADHAGHVPRIRAGVALLGMSAKMEFVLVQMVKIMRDGQPVKMSKRKGTLYELDDLIEDIGPDACRIVFLMRTSNAQLVLDLGEIERRNADNPVFYFQYGHARCAQVLKKAQEKGVTFAGAGALSDAQLAKLTLPEEKGMLKKMSMLPDVVEGAAEALEPHRVLNFCQELIADFHGYYTKYKKTERVISDDVDKTQGRLALIAALKHTLKSAFGILGIDAPEYMPPPETAAAGDAAGGDDDDDEA